MKENYKLHAPPVQYPVEPATEVAAELAQLALDLRTVWKGEMGVLLVQRVDSINLAVDGQLNGEPLVSDELVDGFGSVRRTVKLRA